ncbi:MAG: hypothetical protein SVY53_07555 [Chloroflexota bacterium]|nr:hypothetical protein [Chloroflexota bacterium]
MSEIDDVYLSIGADSSSLGKPIGEERDCSDGIGRFRTFQDGAIFWHPHAGAHEIHGDIYSLWVDVGLEGSPLGYPLSDQKRTPEGDSYWVFEHGVIHQKTNDTARMAATNDIPEDTVLQLVTVEIDKLLEGKSLLRTGEATLTKVHEWYDYAGKYYYGVAQIGFDMEAEAKAIGTSSMVDLQMFFTLDAIDGNIIVTLLRERHTVIPRKQSYTSRRRQRRSRYSERNVGTVFSRALDDTVDNLIHRELIWQLSEAVGKSGQLPIGPHLLAAQPMADGKVRMYLSRPQP